MKVSGAGANIENEKKIKIAEIFFMLPGFAGRPGKKIFIFICEVQCRRAFPVAEINGLRIFLCERNSGSSIIFLTIA
jgi:hypothetical protein